MLNRAYSLLEVKAIDDDERVITGVATTMSADRVGDIVEPQGAEFKLPIPFLWQHNSREPIGEVFAAKVTAEGIEVKARILKIDEPGALKERLDTAWQSIKHKLVRGLSIGFSSIEHTHIDGTFGMRFIKWLWLELSAVTIPANADATIQTVKSVDAQHLAVSREDGGRNTPGASGTPVVRLLPSRAERTMKSLQEQITSYKSTRDAKFEERQALMTDLAEKGLTPDKEQDEKYETLDGEIKALDKHITRLEALQEEQKKAAIPAAGGNSLEAHKSRGGEHPVISVKSNLPPGIEFARAIICKYHSFKFGGMALDYAKQLYPDNDRVHAYLKATVPGATTGHVTWAGPLVDPTNLPGEFIEFLRPATIIGKFGANGIPSLRRIPFNVRITSQTSGGDAYWVSQGAPKPLTKFDFGATTLGITKIASIAVMTEESLRLSVPSLETLVRDALRDANVERADIDFVDPTVAAVADTNPASITNGLTALAPSGTSADAARSDFARLVKAYLDDNNRPAGLVIIMPDALALALSVMVNSLGQREFPDITMEGGRFLGVPVITSQYLANRSGAGNLVVAVNAPDVFLADDGGVTVDVSREASLQMLDNPTNSSATATATTMVSMFQTNSVALRAERHINWAKRRSGAAVYMDDVNWGSIGSPA